MGPRHLWGVGGHLQLDDRHGADGGDESGYGLRVDHPDGLYDPKQYFERLREANGLLHISGQISFAEDGSLIKGRLGEDMELDAGQVAANAAVDSAKGIAKGAEAAAEGAKDLAKGAGKARYVIHGVDAPT